MKKTIYIIAFAFLGLLAQFVVHAVGEMIYIKLLISNFEVFGLGFSFDTWFLIHSIYGAVLFVVGLVVGAWQGFYWWPRIYGDESP